MQIPTAGAPTRLAPQAQSQACRGSDTQDAVRRPPHRARNSAFDSGLPKTL